MSDLTTVYKKNGGELKVNLQMLPYLDALGLSKTKPKPPPKTKTSK